MWAAWSLSAASALALGGGANWPGPALEAFNDAVVQDVGASLSPGERGNRIAYHGGPLLLGAVTGYYIWYGDWSRSTAPAILVDLALHLGGSRYWNINTTYHDDRGTRVTNALRYGGSTADAYSHGTSLSDKDVEAIAVNAVQSGALPADANGVYFVFTSADVAETSGFCSRYCGWHNHAAASGVPIRYAFVGDGGRCLSSCAAQTTSPNQNPGADAMASILAHEWAEAVTDPDANAWFDGKGLENADKCAWTFGSVYPTANGSWANLRLGGRDYLLQQNWVNDGGGGCEKSY